MLNNKIIIGTANFDQKYGVRSKKIDQNGIRKIINYAFKKKINKFDTSASYKNSEKILGNLLQKKNKSNYKTASNTKIFIRMIFKIKIINTIMITRY